MKPIWKLLMTVAVVFAVLAALIIVPHYRAKAAVNAYRAQLKARGEKVTIAELSPVVSAEAVGAGRELLAAGNLPDYFKDSPPMMRWLAPGHALVGWSEAISPTESLSNCWPAFAEAVGRYPENTAPLAAALKTPEIGFQLQYERGYSLLLPHLAQLKKTSLWLAGATVLAMHNGDTSGAWENLKAEVDLSREYRGEPLIICQLVRAAMAQIALQTTWEALQYPGWSESQLAELQTNWEAFDLMDGTEAAISMERAIRPRDFDEMRKSFASFQAMSSMFNSSSDLNDVLVNPGESLPGYLGQWPRFLFWKWWGSYHEELHAMQVDQAALEAVRTGRMKEALVSAIESFSRNMTNLAEEYAGAKRQFMATANLPQWTTNFLYKIAVVEMERRMVVAAIALERHRRQQGKFPEKLGDLAPNFFSRVPIDFMDGKQLRYRREEDGAFLLYSVGEDGKDDGGDGSPVSTDTSTHKRWFVMRDAVWPFPATSAEVKNYEAEMLKKVKLRKPGQLVPPMSPTKPAGTNSTTN